MDPFQKQKNKNINLLRDSILCPLHHESNAEQVSYLAR